MSYATITKATQDVPLQERVSAGVQREAWNSPTLSETLFGAQARQSPATGWTTLIYPVAIDTEAAYEFALNSGNADPGGDPSVITDAALLAAIQAHWPEDAEVTP